MDLLLDTHAFIWFLNGDNQIPDILKKEISNASNKCYISIASLWEIAIKLSLKKLDLNGEFGQIATLLNENDIEILPITFDHIQRLLQLEFYHRDPFDRIIIAQALTEKLTLATKDEVVNKYEVDTD